MVKFGLLFMSTFGHTDDDSKVILRNGVCFATLHLLTRAWARFHGQ